MTTIQDHFRQVAPPFMALLRADFPMLDADDASAVFGNGGYESKGLTDDQEDKPVVPGSRGGVNWMQWTGPRRRAFEAYCQRTGRDSNSDEAAYAWLFVELKTTEKHAIAALRAAKGLDAKTKAFCDAFLRPGVKAYAGRQQWAAIAKTAYVAAGSPIGAPSKVAPMPKPPIVRPGAAAGGASAGLGALVLAALLAMPLWVWLLIVAVAIGGVFAWPQRFAILTQIRIQLGKL